MLGVQKKVHAQSENSVIVLVSDSQEFYVALADSLLCSFPQKYYEIPTRKNYPTEVLIISPSDSLIKSQTFDTKPGRKYEYNISFGEEILLLPTLELKTKISDTLTNCLHKKEDSLSVSWQQLLNSIKPQTCTPNLTNEALKSWVSDVSNQFFFQNKKRLIDEQLETGICVRTSQLAVIIQSFEFDDQKLTVLRMFKHHIFDPEKLPVMETGILFKRNKDKWEELKDILMEY